MQSELLSHYEKFFGPGKIIYKNTTSECPVDLVHFPAGEERNYHTIATVGLSAKKLSPPTGMESQQRQEFLVYLPENWAVDLNDKQSPATWACMFLFFATRYIIDKQVFIGHGSVLHTENTRPTALFRYPYAVLIPPFVESPKLFPVETSEGTVELNTITLLTDKEADFMKNKGIKALVEKMVAADTIYPVMDPLRPCTFEEPESPEDKAARMADVDAALAEIEEEERQEKLKRKAAAPRAEVQESEKGGCFGMLALAVFTGVILKVLIG